MTCQLCCNWSQLNRYKVVFLFSFGLTKSVMYNGLNRKCNAMSKYLNSSMNLNEYIYKWPPIHAEMYIQAQMYELIVTKILAVMRQRQPADERMNSRPIRRLSC